MTDKIDTTHIDQILERTGRESDKVIAILQAIQHKYNYLPEEALRYVCESTEITPASIVGVASFYSQFRFRPSGEHSIKVCIGTACHVMGAESIYDAFRDYLKISGDEDTDADRLFTVEKVACLGCCMLAPAVQIDDITYGFVKTGKVGSIIKDFLSSQNGHAGSKKKKAQDDVPQGEVRLCSCSSCVAAGARQVHQAFEEQIQALHLPVKMKTSGCTGMAYQTPLVQIHLQNGDEYQYGQVKPIQAESILLHHFKPTSLHQRSLAVMNRLVEKLYTDEAWEPVTRYALNVRQGPDADYVQPQHHIVTDHFGEMDPLSLDEYQQSGGYQGLTKCIQSLASYEIIQQVETSGLRGRGGAGYPTALKWKAVLDASGKEKYLICNGDEGDPGAFMDRMILESFPYRVIEGMTIASYALGIHQGYLYVRAEYPLAIERVSQAIQTCHEANLLGQSILGSAHHFEIKLIEGAGAFVCGEETALIASIEGRRGIPRLRPPYPSQQGLNDKPTLVSNVETYSIVPFILHYGADQFNTIGTAQSKGTKTFALAGKIKRSGLIEVPMGISLREIVHDIGGGMLNDGTLKAIQVGGPSGGCVPASQADIPVDYEALKEVGGMMGSGGMVVLDEADCMVDIAKYFMTFTQDESCGQCTFCRIGTKRMLEILERLCTGEGRKGDIESLEQLAAQIQKGSICGLGKTAPNPVLSTLAHFREEYEAHIEGRCPAGKCKALITYSINDNCIGCTRCAQRCPSGAIEMRPYEQHEIDVEKCVRCDSCRQVCPSDAVEVC